MTVRWDNINMEAAGSDWCCIAFRPRSLGATDNAIFTGKLIGHPHSVVQADSGEDSKNQGRQIPARTRSHYIAQSSGATQL